MGRIAGRQQIHPGVCGNGPVVVLAGTVDPGKGLFMEQAHKIVAGGNLPHDLHGELVVVRGDVCGGVDRGQLMLGRSHLIVLGLRQNSQLPELLIQVVHVGLDPRLDGSKVVIVQLLALGRPGSKQGPARKDQVRTLLKGLLVHQKVFLLRADGGGDPLHIRLSKELQDPESLPVDGFHGPEQRCFLVQRFTAIGTEGGGDAKGLSLDKGVAGGVPGGIAPRLEGCPQTAGGEGRGIRLALDQLFPGEFHNDPSVRGRGDETVMLLGRGAGQRLEPVGKVGGPLFDGPIPHGGSHGIGHIRVQGRAASNGLFERIVNLAGQSAPHDLIVEYHTSKDLRYAHFVHPF